MPRRFWPGLDPGQRRKLADARACPALRSIHFDFDKSDIRKEFRPVLEDHARYLRANPG